MAKKIIVFLILILLVIITTVWGLKYNKIKADSLAKKIETSKEQRNSIIQDLENIENNDNSIFRDYKEKANKKLQTLSLDEKIAQLFIVGTSLNSDFENLKKYQFGGYLFFRDFFNNKTEEQLKKEISGFQSYSRIPLLIAVDEEGGSVVRVSHNKNLIKQPFKSPSELYKIGGSQEIRKDTINKSTFLSNLGINLNFAPVVDITTNPNDYMYKRALQQEKDLTAMYARTVISASKDCNVSYTLKHFPGYGNNKNTHTETSVDTRTYEDIYYNDLEPFRAGIKEGAEIIMVSHNTVTSIDNKPASISTKIHELLRNELGFTGIIITDDIKMDAIQNEYTIQNAIIEAILAGNDMIIVTIDKNTKITYKDIIETVKTAIEEGKISSKLIDKLALNVLSWKYYKGLL